MAVAYDSEVASAAGTGNLSATLTVVGTIRAVAAFVVADDGTDQVSGVTYGGVAMSRQGFVNHATGETGGVYGYFLGAAIPTGNQICAVTVSAAANKRVWVIGLTAAADTEVVDVDATINSDSLANPSVTLSLAGRTCWCGLGLFSGQNAITGITELINWTVVGTETDFGNETAAVYRYNIVGTTDVTAGWTQTAEDAAMVAMAVSEVQAEGGHPTMRRWGGVPGMLGAGSSGRGW